MLFYTQGARTPALVVQNNRVVNPVTGQAPAFVHAPNHGDLRVVEQWVAGSLDELARELTADFAHSVRETFLIRVIRVIRGQSLFFFDQRDDDHSRRLLF